MSPRLKPREDVRLTKLNAGLTFTTCACGWESRWGTPEAASAAMRWHRAACTALTGGSRPMNPRMTPDLARLLAKP